MIMGRDIGQFGAILAQNSPRRQFWATMGPGDEILVFLNRLWGVLYVLIIHYYAIFLTV